LPDTTQLNDSLLAFPPAALSQELILRRDNWVRQPQVHADDVSASGRFWQGHTHDHVEKPASLAVAQIR
jgi:hypothetical protein